MASIFRPTLPFTAAALVTGLALAPVTAAIDIDRPIEQTYRVAAGSVVDVDISGGGITVAEGSAGTVRATLNQRIRGVRSEQEADDLLREYDVRVEQSGDRVVVSARRRNRNGDDGRRRGVGVSFNTTLTVPPNVKLDLHTSGGGITIRGDRTTSTDANTSGGGIVVDGGRGEFSLHTSGGRIEVGEALDTLLAETSGGGIRVDYVGTSAKDVSLDTSGGGIRVGVDPRARLTLTAATSGGHVEVEGLPFTSTSASARRPSRSNARGTVNGGGDGRLSAHTSGGSIEIVAARGR